MTHGIQHVSDTALLVAAARAAETKRDDGLVRDPYAARLAGERGFAIAQAGTPSRWQSFGIGLRSKFIDELLLSEISSGAIDGVVNLGAGLDARPWRLDLPAKLRWIEVDFAHILDYKHGILKDNAPHCRLERLIADLNQPDERERVMRTALGEGNRMLLLTEGLLFYLPAETVRGLAAAATGFYRWILDISPNTSLLLSGGGDTMRMANAMRDATRLEGADVLDVVRGAGWESAGSKTFMKDGARFALERMTRNGWTPDPNTPRPAPDDPSGVWLFRRAASTQTA